MGILLGFVGGLVVGVVFADKLLWVKENALAVYSWIRAKF
jgi:xanthosine utilization system XapX-like protein